LIAGCRNDYDVNGNLLKTKTYLEVKKIQNGPTIMKILMQDVQGGGRGEIRVTESSMTQTSGREAVRP